MKVKDLLEPLEIEWPHWDTPEFKAADKQLDKAKRKQGTYGKEDQIKINTPAYGPESPDTYTVSKAADDRLTFRSERTGITTNGERAFKDKFGKKVCVSSLNTHVSQGSDHNLNSDPLGLRRCSEPTTSLVFR